jgi:hypothetical protein
MEEYISQLFEEKLAGIQLSAWQQFFAIFTEGVTNEDVDAALQKIAKRAASTVGDPGGAKMLAEKFREIAEILEEH